MYVLKNVKKEYSLKKEKETALTDINLSFPDTGMVMIVGKSGSGKTTLLNLLSFFDTPTEGEIEFLGINVKQMTENQKSDIRKHYLGFIFQDYNLFESMSVYDNIVLSLNIKGEKVNEQEIEELLTELGISKYKNKKVNELSGGQKQRVAIARALIKKPKVILCDEPTGALDSVTSKEIFEILRKVSSSTLVITVTHDLEYSKEYGQYIIELKDGRIVTSDCEKGNEYQLIEERKGRMSFDAVKKLCILNIKKKPLRMIIASILTIISTGFLGFPSCLQNVSEEDLVVKSMKEKNEKSLSLKMRQYAYDNNDLDLFGDRVYMGDYEKEYAEEALGVTVDAVCFGIKGEYRLGNLENPEKTIPSCYIKYSPSGFCEVNEDFLGRYDYKMICGRLPQTDEEVALTMYQYSLFNDRGYLDESYNTLSIDNPSDLIGKKYNYRLKEETKTMLITGIVDTSLNKRYTPETLNGNVKLQDEFSLAVKQGFHNVLLVNDGFYKRNFADYYDKKMDFENDERLAYSSISVRKGEDYDLNDTKISMLVNSAAEEIKVYSFDNAPTGEGVYISYYDYFDGGIFSIEIENFIKNTYASELFLNNKSVFDGNEDNILFSYDYATFLINNDYEDNKYLHITRDGLITTFINSKYKQNRKKKYLTADCMNYGYHNSARVLNFKVSGVYIDDENTEIMIADPDIYNEIKTLNSNNIRPYSYLVLPMSAKFKKITSLMKKSITDESLQTVDKENSYVQFEANNEYSLSYIEIESPVLFAKMIASYSHFILIPFVSLMIFYYFSGVVCDSEKEIGILKSLGASNRETLSVYLFHNTLVALFQILCAWILLSIFIPVSNTLFYNGVTPLVQVVRYTLLPYISVLGMILGCIIIGTLIPMAKILRMKIADIVNNR